MTVRPAVPLDTADLPADARRILDRIPGAGLKGAHAPVHVLGTLMHGPATLEGFLRWWVDAKVEMAFTIREQELVILRMGAAYASDYVWRHHVIVGREFGIDAHELDVLRGGDVAAWPSPRERALLILTDEMIEHRTVRDHVWHEHGTLLSAREMVELIQLVAQYVVFALTNNVFRVALEPALADVPSLVDVADPSPRYPAAMTSSLHHVGVRVQDLDRSIAFYRDVLGMVVRVRRTLEGGTEIAFLGHGPDGGATVELIAGPTDHVVADGTVHHLAFAVDDAEAVWERLRALGVTLLQDRVADVPGGRKLAAFRGPDGEYLQITSG